MKRGFVVLLLCQIMMMTSCGLNKLYVWELKLSEKEISSAALWYNGESIELDEEETANALDILNSMVYERCPVGEMKAPGAQSAYIKFSYIDGEEVTITFPCFQYDGKTYKTVENYGFGAFINDVYEDAEA